MARNDKNVVAAALAALEALTAPRTLFRSPVACVPTVTTRHEQRVRERETLQDLSFLLASVASALDPRCTPRYLPLPAEAPQDGRYSVSQSHQDSPSQLSSGRPSYHGPAKGCNTLQGPGQPHLPRPARPRDWLARRPIPGRLSEGSWRFANSSDLPRFLLRESRPMSRLHDTTQVTRE